MKSSTTKLLIWGGIGAAGVAFWYFFFGPGATPATASPSSPLRTTALPGSPSVGLPQGAVDVRTATGAQLNQTQNGPCPGISSTVYSAVATWAQGDGRAGALQLLANCDPTEFANMYDIIVNDWDKSGVASPTQTANWNAIVKKYNLY